MTGGSIRTALHEVLSGTLDATVVNPRQAVLRELVGVLVNPGTTTVRILATNSRLKMLRGRFLYGSRAADLVSDGVLALRTTDNLQETDLILTDDTVSIIVPSDFHVGIATTDDTKFVDALGSQLADQWNDAARFDLRQPPLSQAVETLEQRLGDQIADDFRQALDILDAADPDIDEMKLLVLLAARNDHQQYQLSRWAEDIGLASIASISRRKQALVQQGLVETHKEQIGQGRPRQGLALSDNAETLSIRQLVDKASTYQ